jgi:hypothetical protein
VTPAELAEARRILVGLGWRVRTTGELRQVTEHFQTAWLLGPKLKVDGVIGPKTTSALRFSEKRRAAGLPTASPHFSFVEFRCKCGGEYSACARIWIRRGTVQEAERYRTALGHGVPVVSGCRCRGHNTDVNGAKASKHMTGEAVDFPPAKSTAWFASHRLFRGRGYNPAHLVRHGDTRTQSVTWRYGT